MTSTIKDATAWFHFFLSNYTVQGTAVQKNTNCFSTLHGSLSCWTFSLLLTVVIRQTPTVFRCATQRGISLKFHHLFSPSQTLFRLSCSYFSCLRSSIIQLSKKPLPLLSDVLFFHVRVIQLCHSMKGHVFRQKQLHGLA